MNPGIFHGSAAFSDAAFAVSSPGPSPHPASFPPTQPSRQPGVGTLPVECGSVTGRVTGGLGRAERLLVHQLPGSTGRTEVKRKEAQAWAWGLSPLHPDTGTPTARDYGRTCCRRGAGMRKLNCASKHAVDGGSLSRHGASFPLGPVRTWSEDPSQEGR